MIERPAKPMNILQAMACMEGYYVEGTRPQRNMNPGDIEYGEFAIKWGASRSDGRFAIFANEAEGFQAMKQLLLTNYASLTLTAAIVKYAPSNENDVDQYVSTVCELAGCYATDIMRDLLEKC